MIRQTSILRIFETNGYKKNKVRWEKILRSYELRSAFGLDTGNTKALSVQSYSCDGKGSFVINFGIEIFADFEKAHDLVLDAVEGSIKKYKTEK